MDDNRPKVDPEREEPEGDPPIAGRWLVGAGSALALVILFLTGDADPTPPPTSSTTSTTITRPTVSTTTTTPPTTSTTVRFEASLGPALSDPMLEWSPVEGLTDATGIGGLAEWRGDYWVAGDTQDGPALWRSDDGRSWEEAGSIPAPSTHRVADMTVWNDRLVVAISSGPWITPGRGAVIAYDGREWVHYDLPSGDAGRPDARPEDLMPVGDRLVIHGTAWPDVPDLVAHLEPQLRELVESGRAIAYQSGQGIHVVLMPSGIEVARNPNSETGLPPPSDPGGIALAWVGEDLADLEVDSSFPRAVAPLPDGRLVGTPNFGLALSEDGETWQETGQHPGQVDALTSWRGGIIVTLGESEPVYWVPGGDVSALLPPGLWEEGAFSSPALTGSWGIALGLYRNPDVTIGAASEEVVIPLDEGDLHVGSESVRLLRAGEQVWTATMYEVPAEIDESGKLRLGPAPDTVTVGLDELEEASNSLTGLPMRVEILHSPHGGIWSSTPWEDVAGSESQGSARLLAIDDFLMAVDSKLSWSGDGTVDSVAIGTLPVGG